MNTITWRVAGLTDRGAVRSHNEDNYTISKDERVFVVADGMGGTENGALASKLAVEELDNYHKANKLNLTDAAALKTWLTESILRANEVVVQTQAETKQKMGTTIVAAVQSDNNILHIAHVGDSRAYLVRDGATEVLTSDHSVVMEMVKIGRLSKEQSKKSPFRHLITRCLGHDPEVISDYLALEVKPGDWIILATDGLSAVIDEEQIAGLMESPKDPEQACKKLVEETLAGGAPDNVTVVAIHYANSDNGNGKKDAGEGSLQAKEDAVRSSRK
ncbi:MAG TPA: Stp1/IreP family PP2C-type Ser/Thr phosphatase [Oculatellaceae cyanobacterium]